MITGNYCAIVGIRIFAAILVVIAIASVVKCDVQSCNASDGKILAFYASHCFYKGYNSQCVPCVDPGVYIRLLLTFFGRDFREDI